MNTNNNLQINMPDGAKKIIELLNDNGFEAFIVGGCVRDSLLGRTPEDFDITTNATPYQVKEIFDRTIDTGIEHGTVTVRIYGEGFEVTTYRVDGKYSDNRHPDNVSFTFNLADDLMRRDFTINAMAYNDTDGLVDYYDGVKDLKAGIIRCVGDANLRFSEDALRMLRAIRFSAALNFQIQDETLDAIIKLAPNIQDISSERIQVEIVKLLTSLNPSRIKYLYSTGLIKYIIPEISDYNQSLLDRICDELDSSDNDLVVRLSILLAFVECDNDSDLINTKLQKIIKTILRKLKFDNNTIKQVSLLVASRNMELTNDKVLIRKQASLLTKDLYTKYLCMRNSLIKINNEQTDKMKMFSIQSLMFNTIVAEGNALSIKDLEIDGKDLIRLGYSEGSILGDTLESLLLKVIEKPECNNYETLCNMAVNLLKES